MINKTKITWKKRLEEKQLYEYYKRLTRGISLEKTWLSLKKVNLKIATEYILTVEQNNAIETNHVVAIENGALGSPLTKVANFTYLYLYINK